MTNIQMQNLHKEIGEAREENMNERNNNKNIKKTKRRKISKFNILIISIVLMQIFVYITSPVKHPFEDYFGVILVGLIILAIGNFVKFIIRKIKNK
ncbi:MAG: hypothetical protein Q8N21_02960 [bacterium]|nr:hypothetical protein [bacterium]